MKNTNEPAGTGAPVVQPRNTWRIRLIRYVKRKIDERAAKKQKEPPTDRAARVSANATVWIAFFTFASVAVSVGTFLILRSQLKEMHDGGVDTHNLADAAKSTAITAENTLKSSEKSFRQEERAYLWATSFNMSDGPIITDPKGTHICADVHIVNSGKTPANGVHLWRHATYGPNAERTIRAFRPPEYLTPSGDMLGTTGDKWGTAFTDPVDKATEKALLDGSIPLYVYGVVQYFDIFGDYHETGFCSPQSTQKHAFHRL